ncbi:MAG: RidA family protein [Acidobacteriota bacterium]
MKKIIHSSKGPRAIGPYSPAVKVGNMIFISGQIPLDPTTGQMASGTIEEQTELVIRNLTALLEDSAATLLDVVRTTVFLTDLNDFEGMNAVYSKFFGVNPPARSTVGVASLPKGSKVEIDAIAIIAG